MPQPSTLENPIPILKAELLASYSRTIFPVCEAHVPERRGRVRALRRALRGEFLAASLSRNVTINFYILLLLLLILDKVQQDAGGATIFTFLTTTPYITTFPHSAPPL